MIQRKYFSLPRLIHLCSISNPYSSTDSDLCMGDRVELNTLVLEYIPSNYEKKQ